MDKTLSLFAFGFHVHTRDSHTPKLMLDQMAGDGFFFHLDKNSILFIQAGYKIHFDKAFYCALRSLWIVGGCSGGAVSSHNMACSLSQQAWGGMPN